MSFYESKNLSYKQKECFDTIMHYFLSNHDEKVFVFSGVAGSGKTTLITEINHFLRNNFYKSVANITLTGKAASVMSSKGIPNARTIHSYMYRPVLDGSGNLITFERKDFDEITEDFIIVDESSMVTEDIVEDLWDLGKRVLYVGDINQLPPVSKNDFNIMDLSNIRLEEIHRQAQGSPIIKLAHSILETGNITRKYAGNEIKFEKRRDIDTILHKYGSNYDIVLCGTNKLRVSVNQKMRKVYGMTNKHFPEEHDRAICLKNNYSHFPAIYNGDTFVVTSASDVYSFNDFDWKTKKEFKRELVRLNVVRDSDGQTFMLEADANAWNGGGFKQTREFEHMDFAYALTVHKSQGSEYENVCFVDEDVSYFTDRTKFRYTAVTRSSKNITIIQ